MTLSRSNTPLNDNVQELDKLIEDMGKAQVTDNRKRLEDHQLSSYSAYSSSSNLNVEPSTSSGRGNKSVSPSPLRKLANSSRQYRDDECDELDAYTSRLESELHKSSRDPGIPRGVFVKDVVEEEILVDHVLIQPDTQHLDRTFVTRPSDRRKPSERTTSTTTTTTTSTRNKSNSSNNNNRQVAFRDQMRGEEDDGDDSETYDNTDTEDHASHSRSLVRAQPASSMQSLNSVTTDQSAGGMTDSSSILDPSKVINCYACGGRVVGQVITALGRYYHKEHFTCAHCHQELGTRNFYERDNLPYCERDYQTLFSPKCAACGDPILDKVTIALDQTFHPEHFVCAHCGCQFDADDGFHEKDGKPYCKNDFFDLFANKCAGCNLPITANYITALNVQWHPDCFVCSDCHCPFADGKFFDIDGAPYCEIHYHARRGSLCVFCRQPIIGKCTTAMFRKFHPDHFKCTYCLAVLTKTFKEENDKPYCHDCFDKLYS